MATAALKIVWADTNSDETITYAQISTDSRSMVSHEIEPTTKRPWMNIGSVPANATEMPFVLELPFTYVRARVRPGKLGARPTAWSPIDGYLLNILDDGQPINAVTGVALQVIAAPETGAPGPVPTPPPSTVTNFAMVAGANNNTLDVSWTAVNDGTGNPAKYRIRYAKGGTINWQSATPATSTCGTATPPASIGAPVACSIDGLEAGTQYTAQLESYRGTIGSGAVFGGLSNTSSATTPGSALTPLASPANLQPQGNTTAGLKTFSWDVVPNADQYLVNIHIQGRPYTPATVPDNFLVSGLQAGASVQATVLAGATYDWWIAGVRSSIVGASTGAVLVVAVATSTNPTPTSLTPTPTTVEKGSVKTLTVTLSNVYNQNITVAFTSSDTAIATVQSTIVIPSGQTTGVAVVSGVAIGSCTINATYNAVTRQCALTVVATPPPTGGPFPNDPAGHTLKTDWGFPALFGSGWVDAYYGASLMSSVTNQDGPVSAPSALQARFPIGHPGGNGTGNINYLFSNQGLKQFYCGMWIKVSNPFQSHPVFNKLIYVTAVNGNAHPYIVGFVGEGPPFEVQVIGQAGSNIDNRHLPGVGFVGSWNMRADQSQLFLGIWTRIEVLLRESTTNTSRDGIARWWVNGIKVGDYTNVNTDQLGGCDGTIINPVFGGTGGNKTEEDFIWWDHIRISGTNT